MKIGFLSKYDTSYSADSVEWCPIELFQHLFVCGNYQLTETEALTKDEDTPQQRIGQIQLFQYINDLKLLQTINTAGILDQKWCHNAINNKPTLAVTTSIGTLDIYTLDIDKLQLKLLLNYSFPISNRDRLMLSVDWSTGKYPSQTPQLVASDSQGNIHLFQLFETELQLLKTWDIHSYEAWICAFDYWNTKCVFSGADDTLFIKTETDCSSHTKNESHECGVTSMHSNISHENILATGSYDTHVRIWDARMLKYPQSSVHMNGPVWRVKWDPFKQDYLIVACMDGGVSIVDNHSGNSPRIVTNFTEHNSIAYGVDWCHDAESHLIGSCSFYDHMLCVSKYDSL